MKDIRFYTSLGYHFYIFAQKMQQDLKFDIELSLQKNFNTLTNYLKLLIYTLIGCL